MTDDRARCLTAFERYYHDHYRRMTKFAAGDGAGSSAVFDEGALLKLYGDYCRDSAARLYDSVMKAVPFLPERARESGDLAILDISCFATTQIFRIVFPNAAIHACDKHLKWLEFLEGVEGRRCNLETEALPYPDGAFDLVIFTETLEHIPRSPYTVLGEVRRVLKPGGVLLFSVPNLNSLLNRIKMALGRPVLSVELAYSDSFGHFREYTMDEVLHLLRSLGFEVGHHEHVYYRSDAARASGAQLLLRPLTTAVPAFRPVCLAVARK